ncbi:glycosyl transferase group 1 [Peptoclostridium acidaminophilum DSM 3953]|uniref:Glycosyl transferase group 1 n=1 Tax=Peptoclostridium acidaminophilum DSM 3953 TaxID=1286171 RepID=W8TM64_PEPAC|nr:glycosyltransferase family 4 protein [Peptoclostridium acidaminophilum]AHM57297.1 glycosyl transferase group 1 [Peptoclostridium acidaminophilum DSM 3953]
MKILYISTVFPRPEQNSTIYTDLAEELKNKGNEIVVVASDGSSDFEQTQLKEERGLKVLRVKTGKMYDVGIIQKGLSVVTLKFYLINAIKKYLKYESFDFILFETPPITSADVVKWAMKYFHCPSYLMLKDIFPQNAVDIGLMKKNGIIHNFFRYKEEQLYKVSSVIGCMSKANRKYILEHNKWIDKNKVSIFPNTKQIQSMELISKDFTIRKKYGIPLNSIVAIYGGNMGKPQGLDFFIEIMRANKENKDIFFVLVGRGTERNNIRDFLISENIQNAKLLDALPRQDYEKLVIESDIGLIFLSRNFSIPNFPSRILSYFEYGLPVLAATDINTDFGDMIEASNAGYWSEAGNIESFNTNLNKLINDKKKRETMGLNGRRYLKENYSVSKSVDILNEFYNGIVVAD